MFNALRPWVIQYALSMTWDDCRWRKRFISRLFDSLPLSSTNKLCLFVFSWSPLRAVTQLKNIYIFTALDGHIFCCSVTLLTSFLVLASSSQLPLSHPAAPPEHLKEPLAYMRKAQVSLSALISVTPHSFYLSDSFFGCWIQRRCFFLFLSLGYDSVSVCSLIQASWEKRVLKSLNSMSTELEVPLARMVTKILYITANIA